MRRVTIVGSGRFTTVHTPALLVDDPDRRWKAVLTRRRLWRYEQRRNSRGKPHLSSTSTLRLDDLSLQATRSNTGFHALLIHGERLATRHRDGQPDELLLSDLLGLDVIPVHIPTPPGVQHRPLAAWIEEIGGIPTLLRMSCYGGLPGQPFRTGRAGPDTVRIAFQTQAGVGGAVIGGDKMRFTTRISSRPTFNPGNPPTGRRSTMVDQAELFGRPHLDRFNVNPTVKVAVRLSPATRTGHPCPTGVVMIRADKEGEHVWVGVSGGTDGSAATTRYREEGEWVERSWSTHHMTMSGDPSTRHVAGLHEPSNLWSDDSDPWWGVRHVLPPHDPSVTPSWTALTRNLQRC